MSDLDIVVQHAPRLSAAQAVVLARERYGIEGIAAPLPSERDQNFRVDCAGGESYVLKIANVTEREEVLDFQNAALARLAASQQVVVPRVVPARDGASLGRVRTPEGGEHFVRMLSWVPGRTLATTKPHTRALLAGLGRRLGELDRALIGFTHPAMNRPLAWDLGRAGWVREELPRLGDPTRRGLVERIVERFEGHALPRVGGLRRQVIHNDWNDYNVLVAAGSYPAEPSVIGAVDFGDMLESWTVADLAVACAYAMLGKPDPIGAAAAVVRGYHEGLPLGEDEIEVLPDLIAARLAISVTMAARQAARAPENDYLRISEGPAWDLVAALDRVDPSWAVASFRHACGLSASRTSATVAAWLAAHGDHFASVVNEDLKAGPVAVLDLSVGSLDIPRLECVEHLDRFCALVDDRVRAARAAVGIGRYDEARLVYVSDLFRYATNWDVENRTVHLGIDIFLPAGSEVRAPLDGIVHSVRDNAGPGDYGPTIILEHQAPLPCITSRSRASALLNSDSDSKPSVSSRSRPGVSSSSRPSGLFFYTLFGHLSLDSLSLSVGQRVAKGEVIGRLGDASVNGGWPPHLHLQVITDLLGRSGEFPGVAAPGEREIWLDLCPDPNLILGIPADRFPAPPPAAEEIRSTRQRHVAPNLSVSYRRPLTIVRGHMQYLFDADGRRFLDAVNNVPHVGHCHPRVVEAAARQLAVLNTNTRYLHPLLASYAERLAALMPDPLDVCFIVCSGSEANELALRLALNYTRQAGLVVLDAAYHGNTSSLVALSPYKFDGPGGRGCPAHVRKALLPDVFRGPYKASDPDAGAKYAAHVTEAIASLTAGGDGLAAFLCESLPGCGGQIVLPDGYLRAAYQAVHHAGGVCVADEVQVGFGRVGSHLWGFDTQGVVPDIVTLGKPIGNGYPLAAVVTRREIADAFDNGMEYFNTFGGSQAACAVGHAVLDVMRDERLQERALAVGARLKDGLSALKAHFPVVGDVRGLGLFLGVELVRSSETLEPAGAEADFVANRLRDRGILVSTDGPFHNVLKIKPPLQFSDADADRLVATLREVLEESVGRF